MITDKIIVGADNGISGALCILSPLNQIIDMIPMPTQKTRKGNEIDVRAISAWLDHHNIRPDDAVAVVEEPGGSKSARAAASMAASFGSLRALFVILGFKFHRVTPQAWQKKMLPGCKAGDTKPAALTKAREMWPEESWLATERCKVPHDGLVDSALISLYARQHLT